ncbi:MAG: hypothetical protein U1F43_05715 [Myxococcota bacterium]
MSLSDLISAVQWRRDAFGREADQLAAERQRHTAAAAELERLRERNGAELAGYLLPDLDDEDLGKLERRLHYPVLLGEKRKTEAELAALEQERLALEADPRFAEREVRRIDYDQQLAEIADAAASFRKERAVWEGSKHFRALKERGWFAPGYDGGMFDWLRSWRNCSFLMSELEEAFPDRKYPDDDDVRRGWTDLFEASQPVMLMEDDLNAKKAEIDQLEARHSELLKAPEERYQALYRTLGGLIVDHLRQAEDGLLLAVGKDDEDLATFLKKDVGLKKQAAYLEQLAVTRLDPAIRQLRAEERKLGQKVEKLRYKQMRGKYVAYTPNDLASLRTLPTTKWAARRGSFEKTRTRVAEFDRWDRGSFVESFLWWDLVTRGARGDDLYEVRSFHERHPGWSVATFADPLDGHHHIDHANDLAAPSSVDAMLATDDLHVDAS